MGRGKGEEEMGKDGENRKGLRVREKVKGW